MFSKKNKCICQVHTIWLVRCSFFNWKQFYQTTCNYAVKSDPQHRLRKIMCWNQCVSSWWLQEWPTTFHYSGKLLHTLASSLVTSAPTSCRRFTLMASRVTSWTRRIAGSCWRQQQLFTSQLSSARRRSWATWGQQAKSSVFRGRNTWTPQYFKEINEDVFKVDWTDFCRVSSVPVKCSKWELCAELGDGSYAVDVTKSGNVFAVSMWYAINTWNILSIQQRKKGQSVGLNKWVRLMFLKSCNNCWCKW